MSTDLTLALDGCIKSGESLVIPEPQFLYLAKHSSESVWNSGCEFWISPCLGEENCVLARMVPARPCEPSGIGGSPEPSLLQRAPFYE